VLLSLPELIAKHRLRVTGVVHCGARLGEEAESYQAARISNVTWIEANPGVIRELRQHVEPMGHKVIQALLYDQDDIYVGFHVTNNEGMSSSILQFGTHPTFSPETVFVRELDLLAVTLDTLVAENGITGNFLNMDLQGAELYCLRGATKLLESIDIVYSEVNTAEVYVGCAKLDEMDAFLEGFQRVETEMCGSQGWGDALWLRSAS
jgi:FkbM family methyltransferase